LGVVVDRPFTQALDPVIDRALSARRMEPSAEPHQVLDAAYVLADRVRAGGRLIVVGTDERRSDVATLTVKFVHPVIGGTRRVAARHLDTDQIRVHGRPGDACVVFARSTVNSVYRETVDKARTCGMTTIALVPGVGVPDGRADRVIGVGGGSQESFLAAYHVLSEMVQVLLARDPVAAA
jgi:D-sedoheptulose 7-phosphate isomerase